MGSGLGGSKTVADSANHNNQRDMKESVSRNATVAWDTSLFSTKACNTTTGIDTTAEMTSKTPDGDPTMIGGLSSTSAFIDEDMMIGDSKTMKHDR